MNILELSIIEIMDDFKNYPELQAAWEKLSDRHEEIHNKWYQIFADNLVKDSEL